jgi:hypothetical protein
VGTSGMALLANPGITKKESLLAAGSIFVSRKGIAASILWERWCPARPSSFYWISDCSHVLRRPFNKP